ncbi:MAG: hypothetical protein ACRDRW_08220 [Pseudonocardiaceae bacterium]
MRRADPTLPAALAYDRCAIHPPRKTTELDGCRACTPPVEGATVENKSGGHGRRVLS